RGRARARLGARRVAAGSSRTLRGTCLDPTAGWGRVAQRRAGRCDRALRARETKALDKRPAPLRGPDQRFAEPVSLSSASSNRPSASGLLPLRLTARSRFRPTRAPCSAQGRNYPEVVTGSRPARNVFVAICERIFSEGDPDAVLAPGEGASVEPPVAREHLEAGLG